MAPQGFWSVTGMGIFCEKTFEPVIKLKSNILPTDETKNDFIMAMSVKPPRDLSNIKIIVYNST